MARVAKLLTLNEYLLLLAGDAAQKLIRLKLADYKDEHVKPKSPFEDMYLSVETDGRISNKVYEMLKSAGALTFFTSYRPEEPFTWSRSSSRKQRKRYEGVVSETWFNKYAIEHAVAPKFETYGLVTKAKDTYSTNTERILKTEFEQYRKLPGYNEFLDEEYLYIWTHLDEYDVQIKKETFQGTRHNGFGSTTKEYKVIYPKALLPNLSKGVFEGHAENYVEKHIQWAIKHLLGSKDNSIINADFNNLIQPRTEIEEFKNWTDEFIAMQIERAESVQLRMSAIKLAYELLQDAVEKFGGWDKFKEASKIEFVKYLEEYHPLHMGDDEPDEDLRKLAQWVAEGKNKGFNERTQVLEAGGIKCS